MYKKWFCRVFKQLVSIGSIVMLAACGGGGGGSPDGSPPPPPPPDGGAGLTALSVTPESPVIKVGTSLQMTATGHYDNGGQANLNASVLWLAGGTGDINLNASGLVTAVAPGSDVVTATITGDPALYDYTFVYTSTHGVEGSVAAPLALTLGTPHAGEVNFLSLIHI